MQLRPQGLVELHGDRTMALSAVNSYNPVVHAIAGIARPERFFEMLEKEAIKACFHPFPDHHRFRKSDFQDIPADSMILMTEKDAVKCKNIALEDAWYIPVEAVLSEALEAALVKKLDRLAQSIRIKSSRARLQ